MGTSIPRRKLLAASVAGIGLAAAMLPQSDGANPAATLGGLPVRPLGMTGLMPTLVGFGGGSRYLSIEDEARAEQLIHRAIDLGVRYFDTAYDYGKERESLKRYGKWLLPNYRARVIIATKIQARDAETAKRQIDETLALLKTSVVDVLHIHAIDRRADIDQLLAKDGALRVLRDLKQAGTIRAIGVTGHRDSRLMVEAMQRIEPDCIMTPQNPAHGGGVQGNGAHFTEDVIPYGLKHGIGLLAMKVTAQDTLTGKAGVTATQLVRYAMSLPVASAVIGMSSLAVLESCAEIARTLEPMPAAEMARMRAKMVAAVDGERPLPYVEPGYSDGTRRA